MAAGQTVSCTSHKYRQRSLMPGGACLRAPAAAQGPAASARRLPPALQLCLALAAVLAVLSFCIL